MSPFRTAISLQVRLRDSEVLRDGRTKSKPLTSISAPEPARYFSRDVGFATGDANSFSMETKMGFFDDALKGAVPGGNLATPIAIAAGALLLGKLFGGSSAAPAPAPQQNAAPGGGGLLGGLSDLVQKFQNSGHGEAVNSWVGPGANAPIQPAQVGSALGQQTISDLARQSGLSEQELLAQLAQALPGIVNKLTPNGRLPTQSEIGQ
jgi:uncharacterized protein YidB (DUF937 family)